MVLMEIHSIFVNRKNAITKLLAQKGGAMASERREQLIGASIEIDLILKTLEYYDKNHLKMDNSINLMKNPDDENTDIFKISEAFKRRGGF
jgi:hypothetical protein